ncbi:N-acetyltransferase [Mucilaginibacter hurinus]|uniref:N-acetyltransferase n=1 Tax=Mucilaginibacter hurinus TaxID=2201324 RepID=A0A367GS76_9SPHI|nr:GNAT family N-acetyltransferase [Mucilaginibacter hurinus]RCH55935.1 N-acetyltransferase [Mucilaginibacter hurinus]
MKIFMNDKAFTTKGYLISTDKRLLDTAVIFHYLAHESYWAKGISIERVIKSIENSVCYGIYYENVQIGFARLITDKATFAYLADVFIVEQHRGKGLSKWLIQTIVDDSEYDGIRRWVLATMDAHGLYRQFGFKALEKPDNWMNIFTPYKSEGN